MEMINPHGDYMKSLEQKVDFDAIGGLGKVALNPMYGTARGYLDEPLSLRGIPYSIINNRPDPYFGGHPPEPSEAHIPDFITREAYSHEVSSCGFWPGNGGFGRPAFYSYAYPQPAGFADAAVTPPGAYYSKEIGEFILPYDTVREAQAHRELLLDFLESTYAAAANLGNWDRAALERSPA
jgi:hypothetical protein